MSNTIFDTLSINRGKVKWEDYIYKLTPVQKINDVWFKREDFFAPLGYGGINGSKLRQAIWLVNKFAKNSEKLVSGASIKSPQLPMSTAVALHYGIPSQHVIGATKPETCIKKDMVKMASWFGASFSFLKVGYNPVLQNKVDDIIYKNKNYFKLCYGITIDENLGLENILDFHFCGANQVQNIPDEIETLIIPAGSCNSAISILYGLSIYKPKNLKDVYLIGIGPRKTKFIYERLLALKSVKGQDTLNFKINFEDNFLTPSESLNDPFNLNYINIFEIPKYDYQNEVKFSFGGIEFHPTYEGKIMDYITKFRPELLTDKTLVWIVGSKPRIENMIGNCPELGTLPENVKIESNDWEKKEEA